MSFSIQAKWVCPCIAARGYHEPSDHETPAIIGCRRDTKIQAPGVQGVFIRRSFRVQLDLRGKKPRVVNVRVETMYVR